MVDNAKNLSHIAINVDATVPEENILAFCTNVRSEDAGIRFTYLSYDNQFPGDGTQKLENFIDSVSDDTDSLFIITDSQAAADLASDFHVACAAYGSSVRNLLYSIECIECMTLDRVTKMWQRFHKIPWTITETERLIIREQTEDDIDAIYDIYSDEEAAKYTEDLYADRRDEAEYLRKYIDNQYRFYEFGIWALTLKDSGMLIGRAGISLREGYVLPEIGYIIGKEYRDQGFAKEAVRAVMEYGAEEFGFSSYMAFTKEKNVPSVRLLESLGFRKRGYDLIMGENHAMYTFDQTAI